LQKDSGSDVTSYDVSVKSSDTSWGVLYAPLLAGNTAIGGPMDRPVVSRNQKNACRFHRRAGMRLLVALICCALTAAAQNTTQQEASAPFSTRATHLLGFPNARDNSTGILSVQDDSLQFQQNGKPGAKVKIALVRGVFLGAESKQGGCPLVRRK
jgi:hypothetical protein